MAKLTEQIWDYGPPDGKKTVYIFECPGCGCSHYFDDRWHWNGDLVKPTVAPSILQIGPEGQARCHFFIDQGTIRFCDDSDHMMRGQTVEMIDVPDETPAMKLSERTE